MTTPADPSSPAIIDRIETEPLNDDHRKLAVNALAELINSWNNQRNSARNDA